MEEYKKTLIENIFPFEEISADARKEKEGHPILFELHHWWGRVPLIIARAAVLGSSLPLDFNISEFEEVLGFKDHYGLKEYQKKRIHNYNMYLLQTKKLESIFERFWGTKRPTIVDPFAGGGSIPFESFRMGFNILSNDYNPLAYLIQRATIEYPAIYGEKLLKDVEEAMIWFEEQTHELLKDLYPPNNGKEVANYLHSWVVSCPECGFETPLVTQWWLVKKGKKRVYLEPNAEGEKLKLSLKTEGTPPAGNVSHGKAKCLKCGTDIPQDHIREQIMNYEKEILLATVLLGEKGKEYELPTAEDLAALDKSKATLNELEDSIFQEKLLPQEEIPEFLRGDVGGRFYLEKWHRLLNPRQKLLFTSLIGLIKQHQLKMAEIEDEDYSVAISTYLAFALGKHLNKNCRATKYDRKRENVTRTTSFRGIPLLWDHCETNPFTESSGSLSVNEFGVLKGLEYSIDKLQKAKVDKLQKTNEDTPDFEIQNQSISKSEFNASIIVTDPPYVDDVQYSELSDFFYVFERLALNVVDNLPEVSPKSEDISLSKERTKKLFEEGYNDAWKNIYTNLSDQGIVVIYHPHKSVQSWDFLISSLIENNFRITATWPIHLEQPINPLSQNNASLGSPLLITARKNLDEKKSIAINEAQKELEPKLNHRLKEFWDYGIRRADLTVAAMGAGLDVLTQYSLQTGPEDQNHEDNPEDNPENQNSSDEILSLSDVLKLIQRQLVDYILNRFLDYPMISDPHTEFYLYSRLVGLNGMSMDTAHLISDSLDTDVEFLKSTGIIEIIPKGIKRGVKLLKFYERDGLEIDERDNLGRKSFIDALHTSMAIYDQEGIHGFEQFVDESEYKRPDLLNLLSAFAYFEVGDLERMKALEILRESSDAVPQEGNQTTLF